MKRVTASEHELLSTAAFLVGRGGLDELGMLEGPRRAPERLGPTAMRLLEELLSRGVLLALLRRGGWRATWSVGASGERVNGRLWERHAPLRLVFTARTFRLLQWLTRHSMGASPTASLDIDGAHTLGDELTHFFALEKVVGTSCEEALARQPAFARSPLCWLAFGDVLARGGAAVPGVPSVEGEGAVVLEALRPALARSWVRAERDKARLVDVDELLRIGRAQEQLLEQFIERAQGAGRHDLLSFLVDAGAELLRAPASTAALRPRLDPAASLEARARAGRCAGAFFRALLRLRAMDQAHRLTRFIDDGYGQAQALVADWERLGDQGFRAAEAQVAELESIAGPSLQDPGGTLGASR